MNQHSSFIDKRIADYRKQKRWQSYIIDTSYDDFIRDYGSCLFTNLIRDTFTKTYMSKFPCSDCGRKAEQRCHGINEERPQLIKRALERIWPDITIKIQLIEIVIAFLEEHKLTAFTFKCKSCHDKEPKIRGKRNR